MFLFRKPVVIALVFIFAFSVLTMMPGVGRSMAGQISAPDNQMEKKLAPADDYVARGLAKKLADGSVEINDPEEIKGKRTATAKTFLAGWNKDGQAAYKGRFYGGQIHYKDKATGQFEDIDTTLNDNADGWTMDKAGYGAKIKQNLADKFITFQNQGQELYFSLPDYPKGGVAGKKETEKADWKNKEAGFSDALGTGIDLEVQLNNEWLKKEAVIKSLNALGNLKNKDSYDLTFVLESNRQIDIRDGDKLLSQAGTITTANQVEVIDQEGVTSYIRAPYAQDSSESINSSINIQITYELMNGKIYLTKHLPIDWLKNAKFPVRTDATISPYSGSGDGWVGRGYISSPGESWTTLRNTSAGNYADYTSDNAQTRNMNDNAFDTRTFIGRGYFPFDTSGLTLEAVISVAKLYINPYYVHANGAEYVLVESSQSSTSSLEYNDYDNIGNTEGSTRVTTWSVNNYSSFVLNTSSLSWVDKTGWTNLTIREKHDFDNTEPGLNQFFGIFAWTSEKAGIEYDPYLEIDYNYVPPSDLKVEGETNPEKITDLFPEFNAKETAFQALSYQIQISASSTNWSSDIIWDSGQNNMATTSENSYCPTISYNGSNPLAFDGSKYYWRIKFWDFYNNSSSWSDGSDYFIMASRTLISFP